jgi:hypothetical protein
LDLRIATESEPHALSVRAYLEQVANVTRTHADDLADELERWASVTADARRNQSAAEELYLERYGGTHEELRVRLEGFRQVTGVLPQRFLELRDKPGASVFELVIAPVPDRPSPASPLAE